MLYFKQDEEVAALAQAFILDTIPRQIFFGLFDCQRKWLIGQGYNFIPMMSLAFTIPFHCIWLWVFVIKLDMNLRGVAIAGFISLSMAYTLVNIRISSIEKFKSMDLAFHR